MSTSYEDRADAMLMRKITDIRSKIKTGTINPDWVAWMLQHVAEGNNKGNLGLRRPWMTLHPSHLEGFEVVKMAKRNNFGTHALSLLNEKASRKLEAVRYAEDAAPLHLYLVRPSDLFVSPYHGNEYLDKDVYRAAFAEGLSLCPEWVVPELILFTDKKTRGKSGYWEPVRSNVQFEIATTSDWESGTQFNMYMHSGWQMITTNAGPNEHKSNREWLFCRNAG